MITTTAAIRTASMQRLLHRYAKSSSAGNIQRRGTTFQRVVNREPPSAAKKKQHCSNERRQDCDDDNFVDAWNNIFSTKNGVDWREAKTAPHAFTKNYCNLV